MGRRAKRTYSLSPDTIATVKRLVEERRVALTQDALVERAITEFARRIQDDDDTRLWAQAASDPEFQSEMQALESGFADDDLRAWE